MRFLAKWLLVKAVLAVMGPFLALLAFFGVCWAIDTLDRLGALG